MLKKLILLSLVFILSSSVFAESGPKAKIDFLVNRIKERNALIVYYKEADIPVPPSPISYEIISPAEYEKLLTYMAILQCELNKMPKQTAINSGLRIICIVKHFKRNDKKIEGLAVKNFMFLDAFGSNDDTKRHVIHHEFFHVLDTTYNGPDAVNEDPAWGQLNEASFKYDKNGDFTITRWYSGYIDHPQKGFVNKYSMTSPGEDKAEIYAALCMPDQAKTLDGWARSDEILARKIRYIRKFSIMASKPRGSAPWPDPNAKF